MSGANLTLQPPNGDSLNDATFVCSKVILSLSI